MILRYSYHSEHNADKQDRWIHFALFLVAVLVTAAAAWQFYVHFTEWRTEESWYHLILGVVYLVVAGILAYLGIRQSRASRGETDRYVRVGEEELVWHLTQFEKERSLALADIKRVDRRNVRDLALTLTSGEVVVLPIYLIASHEKQEDLLKVLWSIVPQRD